MSRRMGSPKALLPLAGRPLIAHVVETFTAAGFSHIVIVTGHEPAMHRDALAAFQTVQFVHNPDYAEGEMLSSVQAGVRAIAGAGCDAFLIAPVDQPLVLPETLRMLCAAWDESRKLIVMPRHQGRRGHPVLVSVVGAGEILALEPTETLKTFVKRHRARTLEIDVDDEGVVGDIDTPQQYQAAVDAWAARDARQRQEQLSNPDSEHRSHPACPNPNQTNTTTTTAASPAAPVPASARH
jgi:molybdenum cofactor cytidylyltransferase